MCPGSNYILTRHSFFIEGKATLDFGIEIKYTGNLTLDTVFECSFKRGL